MKQHKRQQPKKTQQSIQDKKLQLIEELSGTNHWACTTLHALTNPSLSEDEFEDYLHALEECARDTIRIVSLLK